MILNNAIIISFIWTSVRGLASLGRSRRGIGGSQVIPERGGAVVEALSA